jgi:hypothetical protein
MGEGDTDAGSTGIHLEAQDQAALVRVEYGYRTRPAAPVSVRWPVGPVAAAFVVSRVVAVAGLLIGGSVDEGRLSTAGLTSWDGQWYLMIARRGYGLPPVARPGTRWPFFPLLPATARAIGLLGVSPRWGLTVVANAAFVIALAGVWRLAGAFFSRRVAVIALWGAAIAPFSSVFSMGYPSSLFLAASTWAFVFVHDRRYLAAGTAGVLATLARPNGVVVLVGLAAAVCWSARTTVADGDARRPLTRVLRIVCGPGLFALGVWCVELWRWSGDPFAFWSAKRAWNELTIVQFVQTWPRDALPHIVVAALAIALIVVAARRLQPAWVLFAACYLLPSLGLGLVGLGRYSGECFPVLVACGIALERAPRTITAILLATSATAMALVAIAVSTYGLIP